MSFVKSFVLKFVGLVAALLAFVTLSAPVMAQTSLFLKTRVGNVVYSHATVGTSTALATSSVSPSLVGWKLCNDAVNTSTYLLVGEAADVATDGVMLDKGQCFECSECNQATLKLIKVKAQASSNGYSVVQYKQQ